MKLGSFLFELGVLGLLILLAWSTTAVLAFAVYFGVWHSLRSLALEFSDLQRHSRDYPLVQFLKDLVPFSLLALGFMGALYVGVIYFQLGISPYIVFLVLISGLTVPHLFTMDKMYNAILPH